MPPQLCAVVHQSGLYFTTPRRINSVISAQTSRFFSGCPELRTRQRRSMWIWLETQGRNFHDPLPGSTNYLGAYDSQGRLKRLHDAGSKDDQDNILERTSAKGSVYIDKPLPRETPTDLMPFPQNRFFRSERVVNEAMREDIWKKVMKDGLSVKAVSSQLGVEMNRVGAIVRLKEIEKEWVRQVRLSLQQLALGS